jgi:hypothetical protein
VPGTQFTCVTSTKVQTPTPELERRNPLVEAAQRLQHLFTCFTSTKVQILTPELERRNPLVEAAQRLQHLCAQALSVPELRDAGVSVFVLLY